MLEIETKFAVEDHGPIVARLNESGARFVGRYHENNHILDRPDGSLREAGCGFRVRSAETLAGRPAPATLTFKGPRQASRLKRREEFEVEIADADEMLRLLTALDFNPVLVYAKRRESWKLNDCRIELDEVPLLGAFVEIEGPSEEAIRQVQDRLGLSDRAHLDRSYVSLLLERCRDLGRSPLGIDFDNG